MRPSPLPTVLAAAALLAAAAPSAAATSVAYVDGGEVMVAELDGTRKHQLSATGAFGAGVWQGVAQSDDGHVAAFRREGASMFTSFGYWDPSGRLVNTSALPRENGWQLYAIPVGFDLTADGGWLVYGYSNSRGLIPNMEFATGHHVIAPATTSTLLEPYEMSGQEWPTLWGRRVIATTGGSVTVQEADGQPPHALGFRPWITVSGHALMGADVSADGRVAAIALRDDPADRILMVQALGGVGGETLGDDCFLPTAGTARAPSLSQDGTRIAWSDDQGVKVAGVPRFNGPVACELTSPPVVISATGRHPSIGGADVSTMFPPPAAPPVVPPGAGAAPPAPAPRPAPGPSSGGGRAGAGGGSREGGAGAGGRGGRAGAGERGALKIAQPAGVRAAALAAGLALRVTAPRAGLVRLVGRVPAARLRARARGTVVVARGSASARRAGRVTVVLKATRAVRRSLGRLVGARLTVQASAGSARGTLRFVLR